MIMIINEFFSNNKYIVLPSHKKPKVFLAVDNALITDNSFKLYNPFSKKAKFLKNFVFQILPLIRPFLNRKKRGAFIKFLENELKKPLVSSVYIATDNNKVVLQLQNNESLGYVKVPLNEEGEKNIINEIKAYEILKEKEILNYKFLPLKYNKKNCLFIENIEGDSKFLTIDLDFEFLNKLKRGKKYMLNKHPRIKGLLENSEEWVRKLIFQIINDSKNEYELVYEHGDFAPWNIKLKDNRFCIFDFEYFTEDGIEYFDFIKYYYQYLKLLENKQIDEIYKFLKKRFNITKEIFNLFIIKEYLQEKGEIELKYLRGISGK